MASNTVTLKRFVGNRWQSKTLDLSAKTPVQWFQKWLFNTKSNKDNTDPSVRVLFGETEYVFHKHECRNLGVDAWVRLCAGEDVLAPVAIVPEPIKIETTIQESMTTPYKELSAAKKYEHFKNSVLDFLQTRDTEWGKKLSFKTADNYANAAVMSWKWVRGTRLPKQKQSMNWLNRKQYFRAVHKHIMDNYTNVRTRHAYLTKLSAVAYHFGLTKAHEYLKPRTTETREARDEEYNKGVVVPRVEQNFVKYEDLIDKVKRDLLPPFNEMYDAELFVKDNKDLYGVVISALIGVLNVVQPNCRDALRICEFSMVKPDPKKLKHGQANLMYMQPNGKVTLYICTDKISSKQGGDHFDLQESAAKVVRESLYIFPRVHVFPDTADDEAPMSNEQYNRWMKSTFTFEDGRVVGTLNIRHAQASYFFIKYCSPTKQQVQWLARRMRHSTDMTELVYRSYLQGVYQGEPALGDLQKEDLPSDVDDESSQQSDATVLSPPTPDKLEKRKAKVQAKRDRMNARFQNDKMRILARQNLLKWRNGTTKPTAASLEKFKEYIGRKEDGTIFWKEIV